MTIKYYVDAVTGVYLGGFGGSIQPDGAVEVPNAPGDARDVWVDGAWSTEDRDFDAALQIIEDKFAAKVAALRIRRDTIMFQGGDQQDVRMDGIQQEYANAVTIRQAEIDALWGE